MPSLSECFSSSPSTFRRDRCIPRCRVGDYVFVSKTAYGYSKYSFNAALQFPGVQPLPDSDRCRLTAVPSPQDRLERGDIAVFKLPRDNETDYVKRMIGLPGDRIQMRDGVLYINGEAIKKETIGEYANEDGKAYFGRPKIPFIARRCRTA